MAVAVPLTSNTSRLSADSRHSILAIAPHVRIYRPPADDDAAVFQTLDAINAIAQRTAREPEVLAAAAYATDDLPAGCSRRETCEAVWAWVRRHVRFVQDESLFAGAREVLVEPPLLLTMQDPRGDCDDFTMLLLAMLQSLCIPARAIVIGADPEQPTRFSHVCAEAVLEDGSRMTLDASHGPYAGWEAPLRTRRLPWTLLPGCSSPAPPSGPDLKLVALAAIAAAGAAWLFVREVM